MVIQGARIKQIIDILGLTQRRFATELGFSQAFISQVVNGTSEISHRFLKKLSGTYSVNIDWVVSERGQMFNTESEPGKLKMAAEKVPADPDQDETSNQILKANIFNIRHRWKIDQDEFGELLGGATRNKVSNWERGRSAPDYDVLSRLEALTGIPQRRIRTQELNRTEIPDRPNAVPAPLAAPGVDVEEVYRLQQEILQRVAAIEEILRAWREQGPFGPT